MIREEIRDEPGLPFIAKTDAQILRELFGARTRGRIASPDEQSEHQNEIAGPRDEAAHQTH
jgi:hypothetical protein